MNSRSVPIDTPIPRGEAVARRLEAEILEESLQPGDKLGTKRQLREEFGVSVATLNEAIRMLDMRGLVDARPGPGGGVFVASPSARLAFSHLSLGFKWGSETFADCMAIRNLLEPQICLEAAANCTADDERALERILDRMARQIGEPPVYMSSTYSLHRRMAKLCHNGPLHTIYLLLLDVLEDTMLHADFGGFDGEGHLADHRALVAAIVSGDPDSLAAAVERHRVTHS